MKVTKNTKIIKNWYGQYAAIIDYKRKGVNLIKDSSWVTKRTAIKRAKIIQADIDDGFIKV